MPLWLQCTNVSEANTDLGGPIEEGYCLDGLVELVLFLPLRPANADLTDSSHANALKLLE